MKRIISLILVLTLLLSVFVITPSAEEEFTQLTVGVLSTEYGYDTCQLFCDGDNRYFMNIYDVARYTRSTCEQKGDVFTITHGTRSFTVDIEDGVLRENGRNKSITTDNYHAPSLVHAVPLLTYLGATCDIDSGMLVISMPTYTLWEALETTGYENYIRADEAFGSELSMKTRLLLNGILKFMDSGFGKAVNAEYRSLLTALQVDGSSYDGYLDLKTADDIKNIDLLATVGQHGEQLENLSDAFGAAQASYKVITIFKDPVAVHLKNKIKETRKSFLDGMCSTAIATMSSVAEVAKTAKDSVDVVHAALRYMPEDARFYNNLEYASYNLKSETSSVVASLTHHAIIEEVLKNNGVDVIADMIDDRYAGSISHIYIKKLNASVKPSVTKMAEASLKIAVALYKAFSGENSIFKYADAETNVIELLRLKEDLVRAMDVLGERIVSMDYSSSVDLNDYRLLRVFYYRALLALNEQFEAMIVAQWGKENRPEMQELIATLREQSNLFAGKLYMLTVADYSAFPSLSVLASSNAWDGVTDLAAGETDGATGSAGNLSWSFDQTTGTVEITGYGDMPDYDSDRDPAPWDILTYYGLVKRVVINEGVTSIGRFAFGGMSCESITIPRSVKRINYCAFDCSSFEVIYYRGTEAEAQEIEIADVGNDALYESEIVFLGR